MSRNYLEEYDKSFIEYLDNYYDNLIDEYYENLGQKINEKEKELREEDEYYMSIFYDVLPDPEESDIFDLDSDFLILDEPPEQDGDNIWD
jgi:hypothetical protein